MKTYIKKIGCSVAVLAAVLTPGAAKAASFNVLDWNKNTWTTGSTSQTFSSTDFGNINFNITGDTSKLASFGGKKTPSTSKTLNGSGSDNTLHLQFDPTDEKQSVTMKTSFAKTLSGFNFTIYDIDASDDTTKPGDSAWNDLVSIQGFYKGKAINPIFNVTNPGNVTASGNTLNGIKSVNNEQDGGNVKVSFGSAIDSFTLNFKQDASLVKTNTDSHGIGISGFEAAAVPEPMTMGGTMLALGLGGYFKKKLGKKA